MFCILPEQNEKLYKETLDGPLFISGEIVVRNFAFRCKTSTIYYRLISNFQPELHPTTLKLITMWSILNDFLSIWTSLRLSIFEIEFFCWKGLDLDSFTAQSRWQDPDFYQHINQCSGSESNNFWSGSSKLKIRNFGSGSRSRSGPWYGYGSFCELEMVKKSCQFWLMWRHKWVEVFNFFNFSSVVYEIMMNLLTFWYFSKTYF